MIRKLGKHRILWFLVAFLSLIAALIGVVDPSIYGKVVSAEVMPGVVSQDLMTIAASIVILFSIVRIKGEDSKRQIVILGIISYLFYAYGIYVIERVYNVLYFLYMAIFALSFWSMVYGVANIRQEILQKVGLSRLVRNVSVVFLLIQPLFFYPLWISQLLPLIQTGQKIEFIYSIYILDLCFIMPAFIIVAIFAIRKEGLGLLLTPALFVLGFTLLLPVGLGEIIKPFYDLSMDMAGMGLFLGLSLLFLVLAVLCLRNLKIPD